MDAKNIDKHPSFLFLEGEVKCLVANKREIISDAGLKVLTILISVVFGGRRYLVALL